VVERKPVEVEVSRRSPSKETVEASRKGWCGKAGYNKASQEKMAGEQ
jgi:hypothetical protein